MIKVITNKSLYNIVQKQYTYTLHNTIMHHA